MFDILIKNAKLNNADISCCQMDTINVDGSRGEVFDFPSQLMDKNYLIENYFLDEFVKSIMYSQCNKIFRRDVIANLRYKPYALGEDILFIFEALSNSNSFYYDSSVGYHYIHRENSAMTSVFSQKRLDYIFATKEIVMMCKNKYPFAYENSQIWFYRNVIVTLRSIILSNNKKNFASFFNEYKKYIIDNKDYLLSKQSLMRKIDFYLILYFNPGLHLVSKIRR